MVKVVFMGTPDFAVTSLDAVVKGRHTVAAVITQPDKPKGRGNRVQPPPVKVKALEMGLEVIQPERVGHPEVVEAITKSGPDAIVVVAYGQILPEQILKLAPLGCLNVHASLLPRYRGAAPINWCIINGERYTGITTMFMDKGMDTGDIIYQEEVEIGGDETAGQLHDRLAALGAEVLQKTLHDIERGNAPRAPQEHSLATYAPQLKRDMGEVDWSAGARAVYNLMRGTDPWPGCFTYYSGRRMKLWRARVAEEESRGIPGRIVEVNPKGMLIQTGKGRLLIEEIQIPSSRRMTVEEYVRGNPITPGEVLGDIGGD